jgi:hypothetical protein
MEEQPAQTIALIREFLDEAVSFNVARS